jgi:hypothetical protein
MAIIFIGKNGRHWALGVGGADYNARVIAKARNLKPGFHIVRV